MGLDYRPALVKQLEVMRARQAAGMPRRGWKVGINVPEVQRRVGLEHALFGWLDGERVLASGETVEVPYGARLHVEPEVCLRLCRAVEPGMDVAQARAAVEALAPALEVVDYALPAGDMQELIAGSMYHRGCVVGSFWPPSGPRALDVARQLQMSVGSDLSEPPRADLVPADAGELLLGLSRVLAEVGEGLQAGDLVLSGSYVVHAMPIASNQVAKADFGRLGVVQCRTVGAPA